MHFARQRDANEKLIIAALEARGASVTRLGDAGVPDLLVGWANLTLLMEVKNPAANPSKGAKQRHGSAGGIGVLTSSQVKWWAQPWEGGPRYIVESVDEALAVLWCHEVGRSATEIASSTAYQVAADRTRRAEEAVRAAARS